MERGHKNCRAENVGDATLKKKRKEVMIFKEDKEKAHEINQR
jgi:hypothetical protein